MSEIKKQETIEDIVAWLREPKIKNPVRETWRDVLLANWIEEAWKREKSQSWHQREMEELVLRHEKEVIELKKQIDNANAAAMREALIKCRDLAEIIWKSKGVEDVSSEIAELKDTINAALSAPQRNCDVGTVEEQAERFAAFCRMKDGHRCHDDCPLRLISWPCDCGFRWAQMPYEEERRREMRIDDEMREDLRKAGRVYGQILEAYPTEKMPSLNFPHEWDIQIIPPFGGAMMRFVVKYKGKRISVFADFFNNLGYFKDCKPYWEMHPRTYKGINVESYTDVMRFPIENTKELINEISKELMGVYAE